MASSSSSAKPERGCVSSWSADEKDIGRSNIAPPELDDDKSHFTAIPSSFKQLHCIHKVTGVPKETDFKLVDVPTPELKDGEFLARVHYYGVDPYYRLFVGPGAPLTGAGVATVVASKSAQFPVGAVVSGRTCASEYVVVGNNGAKQADVVDDSGWRVLSGELGPYSTAVSVLGMPGATAWIGVQQAFKSLAKGSTVIVSGAAGQVGNFVGQLLKRQGLRVIGIAGGPEKVAKLLARGFDVGLDYKKAGLREELAKAAPGGADGYWENVGGDVGLSCHLALKKGAVVAKCGGISTYNDDVPFVNKWSEEDKKAVAAKELVESQVTVFASYPLWEDAFRNLSPLIKSGDLKYDEIVVDGGLAAVPAAFAELFQSGGLKKLVRISKEPSPQVLSAIRGRPADFAAAPIKTSIP